MADPQSGTITPTPPEAWQDVEAGRIKARRERIRDAGWDQPPDTMVGLALSGGGIRSATFSLGVLRALSRLQLLHKMDYLSTVSGGGYVGAFLCSLFARYPKVAGAPTNADAETQWANQLGPDPLGTPEGAETIARLRQSGRYLAPSGARDLIYAFGILARNWIAIHVVIAVTIMALVLLLNSARALAEPSFHTPPTLRPWVSPLIYGLIPLMIAAAAASWAYWLTKRDFLPVSWIRYIGLWSVGSIVLAVLCVGQLPLNEPYGLGDWLLAATATTAIAAVLMHLVAELLAGTAQSETQSALVAVEDRVRHRLSRWLSHAIGASITLAVLAALDSAALFLWWKDIGTFFDAVGVKDPGAGGLGIIAGLVGAIVPLLRKLVSFLGSGSGSDGGGRLRRLLARFGTSLLLPLALLLLALELIGWSVLAHYLSWEEGLSDSGHLQPSAGLLPWLGGLIAAAAGLAISYSFINLSSLATFYAARLRRAYLGATNPARIAGEIPVTNDHAKDEISLYDYYGLGAGPPVHLINVTINETKNPLSNLVQRDRKGKPLCVSPAGYLFPHRSQTDIHRIELTGNAEPLPLSSWIGISGAAFSTGAGSNTTLAQAIIAGLANVRLGYWWRKHRISMRWWPGSPGDFVQMYLFREFRAAYEGTATERLYLSDGGHFENTGAYELLRRHVPFIIVSDNGCDPNYHFDDVANLIRKARIDLGIDVNFLGDAELTNLLGSNSPLRPVIGSLKELADPDRTKAGPVAAIAKVIFPENAGVGRLLLIKPRLSGDGPQDLLRYAQLNSDFPQQTTLDQFFDEAQWESYYLLGQRIVEMVFDKTRYAQSSSWRPWNLA